jgi:hypothetical protein
MTQQATKLYVPAPHLTWFGVGPTDGVTRLTTGVVVGREPDVCDVILESDLTSRRHARIEASADGRLEVVDLDSRNGTFVNGRRVASVRLSDGDRIGFGSAEEVHCVFRAAPPAPAKVGGRKACGACGTPAREGGNFCHWCGSSLAG